MAYHWLYSVEFLMRLVLLIMTFLNQTLAAILLNRRICRFESYGAWSVWRNWFTHMTDNHAF